jgi:L-fuconolactonase
VKKTIAVHIDAHQHFWIYNSSEYAWIDDSMAALRRNFLPQDLERELQRNHVQGSILVQTRQTLEETRWLLELAEQSSSILGVVGWVDLQSPDVLSQLEEFAENPKLVGVRHIVQAEADDRFLMRPAFLRGVSLLERFDLAYDILIYPRHLPVAAEFAKQLPQQRLVLDHLAKPPIKSRQIRSWADEIHRLAEVPNVFSKLSGLVTESDWHRWTPDDLAPYLDIAFESFGPQRLMIGSDWPVCLVAATYERATAAVKQYLGRHSPEVREAVLGGNARQFYLRGK